MICIHDGEWELDGTGPGYLEEVFVTKTIDQWFSKYYQLHGYVYALDGLPQYFLSKWFIPCSDLDETVIHDIKPELEPETII